MRESFVACDVHFDLMIRSHNAIQFRFDSIWFDFVDYFLFRRHIHLLACIFSLHTHSQHRLDRNQYLYTYHTKTHMQSILLIWFRWKWHTQSLVRSHSHSESIMCVSFCANAIKPCKPTANGFFSLSLSLLLFIILCVHVCVGDHNCSFGWKCFRAFCH